MFVASKERCATEIPYTSPSGVETTLYNIGYLADCVGRTSQTIRKWEIAGILPPTPFRVKGRRYYSTEQIDIIVKSAEKSHIVRGKSICDTWFSKRIYRQFEKLYETYGLKKGGTYEG